MNNTVTITINRSRFILAIENNNETEGYRKADIEVGQQIPKQLLAMFLMNPHRFNIIWEGK
jgi:hypothetical protein